MQLGSSVFNEYRFLHIYFLYINRESKRGKTKLCNHAETVKHILSTLDTAKCYIESLYDGIDFSTNVTRARFENEMSKVIPSLVDPIQEVLAASGMKASEIDKVNIEFLM